MAQNNELEQLARQLTFEYFKENHLFPDTKYQIDNTVKEFIEIENIFYSSLNKNRAKFKKFQNPTSN